MDICFLQNCIANSYKWNLSQRQYVNSHIQMYHVLLSSESIEEFLMNFEIMNCSMRFPLTDYIAIFVGALGFTFLFINTDNAKILTILLNLIDDFDVFDDAMHTTVLPKAILSSRSLYKQSSSYFKHAGILLAHMFNKFPDLFSMNFNFRKLHGKRLQRFSKDTMNRILAECT